MSDVIEVHDHVLEFKKNKGKSVINILFDDEEGQDCFLIDIFSIDGKDYCALVAVGGQDLYILEYEDMGDNNISLGYIDDDLDAEEVYDLFGHYRTDEMIDNLLDEYYEDYEEVDDDYDN